MYYYSMNQTSSNLSHTYIHIHILSIAIYNNLEWCCRSSTCISFLCFLFMCLFSLQLQNDFNVENIVYESVAICTSASSGQDQRHTSKQCLNGFSSKYQVNTEYVQVTTVFYNSSVGDDNTRNFIEALKKALSQTSESTKVCPGTKWK